MTFEEWWSVQPTRFINRVIKDDARTVWGAAQKDWIEKERFYLKNLEAALAAERERCAVSIENIALTTGFVCAKRIRSLGDK